MRARGTPEGKGIERAGSVSALWSEYQSIRTPFIAPAPRAKEGGSGGPALDFRAPQHIPDPGSGMDEWSTRPSIEVINDRKSGPIVLNLDQAKTARVSVTADSVFSRVRFPQRIFTSVAAKRAER